MPELSQSSKASAGDDDEQVVVVVVVGASSTSISMGGRIFECVLPPFSTLRVLDVYYTISARCLVHQNADKRSKSMQSSPVKDRKVTN